ncbi:MAG: lipoprotein-releasing ABC transporter permease subunit [Candidatus Omnitrophota bacterium]|nr:lipoprotein-releasing ABC transporter permease subunit [Candidatus Omnitrophota bacterium]
MAFERFIAWKHLAHRRKTGFISLISIISVAGVSLGVMALIVVLAVMSGFDRELKMKIVNVQPHLRIEKVGGILDAAAEIGSIRTLGIPGLETAASYVEGQAIVRSQDNATGVLVKGVDSQNEDLALYREKMKFGALDFEDTVTVQSKRRLLFSRKVTETELGGIVIGESLAAVLRVRVGDIVHLISPFQDNNDSIIPLRAESRPFLVKGIFRMGMSDFDSGLALISLSKAQALYHLDDRVTGLSLRFADVDEAERWKFFLRGHFSPDYYLRTWYDMNQNFFQALKVEKSVMTILLALIVLVAAFNIVSTLIMIVMEKTRDIGILRSIGATRASIRRIFLMEGFTVGILGVATGTVLGLLVTRYLNNITAFIRETTGLELFPSDIYYFDKIPTEIHAQDVVAIVSFALITSIVAGFYPAHRAASLSPVEALRYE